DSCNKVSINNIAKDDYNDNVAVSLDRFKCICDFVTISIDNSELYIIMEENICVNEDDCDINDKVLVDSIVEDGCDNCIR
ncbi:797_t:CDS:1, partial [Ambispora gerdemannii]